MSPRLDGLMKQWSGQKASWSSGKQEALYASASRELPFPPPPPPPPPQPQPARPAQPPFVAGKPLRPGQVAPVTHSRLGWKLKSGSLRPPPKPAAPKFDLMASLSRPMTWAKPRISSDKAPPAKPSQAAPTAKLRPASPRIAAAAARRSSMAPSFARPPFPTLVAGALNKEGKDKRKSLSLVNQAAKRTSALDNARSRQSMGGAGMRLPGAGR